MKTQKRCVLAHDDGSSKHEDTVNESPPVMARLIELHAQYGAIGVDSFAMDQVMLQLAFVSYSKYTLPHSFRGRIACLAKAWEGLGLDVGHKMTLSQRASVPLASSS